MATCAKCHMVCDDRARFCPNCANPLGQQGAPVGYASAQPAQAPYPQSPAGGYQQFPPGYGQQAMHGGYGAGPPPQATGYQPNQAAAGGAANVVQPVAPPPFTGGPATPGAAPHAQAPIPAGFGFQPAAQQTPPPPPAFAPPRLTKPAKPTPLRFIPMVIGPVITVGVLAFFLINGGSCSSVEGSFQSSGEPLGTFTFAPAQCRSGERMNVHGAILVGEGPTEGGIMVLQDPVQGSLVKVELPGSCQPPDYEVCTEVTIDKAACKVFKVKVRRTNTTVNDIRLMDGNLELDCQFKEGGTAKAKLDFESCD